MVEIKINIEKKHLWLLVLVAGLFASIGYVIGYGTNQPSVFGHTLSELNGAQTLTEAQSGIGTIVGAVKVQGGPYIQNTGGTVTSAVSITSSGGQGTEVLYTEGPVTIYPRTGNAATDATSLFVGQWELRHIPNVNKLCVNWGTKSIGFFRYDGSNTGAWYETDMDPDCIAPPP